MIKIPLKSSVLNKVVFVLLLLMIFSCKNKSGDGSSSSSSWFFPSEELGNEEMITEIINSPADLSLFYEDSVVSFYQNREYEPVWSEKKLREAFIENLKEAEVEGLFMEDYHGDKILASSNNLKNLNDREKSEFDITLTDAFFKFGNHLLNGKLDPKEFHEIWDTKRDEEDVPGLLSKAIDENDIEGAIKKLRPSHLVYQQLIVSSKEYKELADKFRGWEQISSGEMIKPDKEDERIPLVQERLYELGYLDTVVTDSIKNSKRIQEAVKKFQGENGLQADGIIGNSTVKLLNLDYNRRYEQILVNLERWRWYPRDLGEHYIIVNIANFDLHVVKDNDTIHTHRTMVGTEARKTPVFSREIKYIVFNPTWTIPPTIKSKDVIPGMRRNSSYLANKRINVYDQSGNAVDPSSINWNGNEATFYTYRQNPGSTNPLGRVKIMYPNEYLIYLHDTPSQSLFERNSRDQSSGCVRVENAVDLAKYLLSDQDEYSSKKIDEILTRGTTKQIDMKQNVNVHHFYWTAWRENGKTRFTADIYGYDPIFFDALRKAI